MNLIDRYVFDVVRRLPEHQREDVGRELRVEIEAMAEDETVSKKPSKKHIYNVLMRMGDPALLADQYAERQRYIIGPLYYEMYLQVLKTVLLIVIPIITFLTFTGKLATVNDHFIMSLIYSVGAGIEVAMHVFFWVSLTFFLVERYSDGKDMKTEAWTPDKLPMLPVKQQISKTDALVGVAWSVLAVWACIMQIPDVHRMIAPEVPLFFAGDMWPYWTLTLLGLSLLSLIAEVLKLIIGGWTGLMTTIIVFTNTVVITFFISVINFVKPVVNPEFTAAVSRVLNESDVTSGMDFSIKVFIAVVVIVSLYEIVEAVKCYVIAKRRNA